MHSSIVACFRNPFPLNVSAKTVTLYGHADNSVFLRKTIDSTIFITRQDNILLIENFTRIHYWTAVSTIGLMQ